MKRLFYFFRLLLIYVTVLFSGIQSSSAGNVYSFDFNGNSESLYISDASGLNVTNHWTFEAWIYVNSVSGYDDFMFRNNIFSFQVKDPLGSGDFALDFYNRDNSQQLSTGATDDLSFNKWYHVAATFDGTTAKLWVNGNTVDNDATAANWTLQTNSENFNIAARHISGYSNYFDGQIDELRLSNIARTSTEMQTAYREEAYLSDANTLLLIHFDDGSSPPTYISGTGFAGTMHNHNTSTSNYKFSEIASAYLLRPNYRSLATGDWNNTSTWQFYNGSTSSWENATLIPDYYDDTLTIRNGHTVTVNTNLSVNELTIKAGGQLIVDNGITLTLNDGTGTDLDVYGVLKKSGVILRNSGATIVMENGGKYQHNTDGSISTATWEDGSECEIIGVGSGTTLLALGNTGQNFDKFTWNIPTQTRDVAIDDFTDTYGDFKMANTNGHTLFLNTTANNKQINIGGNGDFILQDGTIDIASGSGDTYFVIYNNFTQTGGTLTSSGSGTGYLRFGRLQVADNGTFSKTDGTLTPDDIQVNRYYTFTFGSDWDVGNIPFTVHGKVTLPAGYNFSFGSGCTIISKADYNGSFINHGSVSSDFTVQCYFTSGKWHGFSAPVQNQTAATFYLNGNPDVWMLKYNESTDDYTYISDVNTQLGDMKGWFVWLGGSGSHTFSFSGSGRSGTVGSDNNMIRTSNITGYNFVGNPFTSAIDWDATSGWTKTNLENAIYLYHNGNWVTYIGSAGTNGGSSHIAMNQGFFVQVTDNGGSYPEYGTLKMTDDVCVHNDVAFMKTTANNVMLLRLQIQKDSLTDETVIRLRDDATEGWDNRLDAHKLFSFNPMHPQIYSTANGFMSINSLPPSAQTVPLDVRGNDGDVLTVSLTESDDFDNVFLQDNMTGQIINLKKENYSFTYNKNVTDRFMLSFLITGMNKQSVRDSFFTAFGGKRKIRVHLLNSISKTTEISVYNLLGQKQVSKTVSSNDASVIINQSGYYIVKVNNGTKTGNRKVFVR